MFSRRPQKRTKIVATLGPASSNEETLREMILAGLDVVRINFSHGKPETVLPVVELVRKLSDEMQVPIGILGDLRGPRMRVGEMENGFIELITGQHIRLTPRDVIGTPELITVSVDQLAQTVSSGKVVLLDDGDLELVVEHVDVDGDVVCRIRRGGKLSSNRGINLPGQWVDLPAISDKDFSDLDFIIEQKFDFVALSFVQSADDVRLLNAYLAAKRARIPVISKIERKSALDDIENIVRESYGVMVARGDLALEMSLPDIPIAQKKIIAACRRTGTPVITATQMMETMINSHKPTRAEATDVANAILDGTDAIMLSGETAIGKYPARVIERMSDIAMRTEEAWLSGELPGPIPLQPDEHSIGANVAYASQVLAKSLKAKVVATYTTSGATALRVSAHRPPMRIVAFTSSEETKRRLCLTWGAQAIKVDRMKSTNQMVEFAMQQARDNGLAEPGEILVMTGSARPYGVPGKTNSLRVERIPAPQQR